MKLPKIALFVLAILCGVWMVGNGEARSFVFEVSERGFDDIDRILVSPFLRLTPDRGNFGAYYIGENLVLSYWSARDGYVSIFNYTSDGNVKIVKNNEPIVAEAERRLYGTVSGPEGMEKFVLVLSKKMLPDRLLIEAMKNPSRMKEILGEEVYFQKAVIQVIAERVMAASFLRFDRVLAEVSAGGRVKISVFLSDEVGNALVGRRIQWEVSEGTLDSYQSLTNTAGRAEVWYTAPRPDDTLTVRVSARFEGDTVYRGSYGEVTFVVNPDQLQTFLTLSPKTFQIASGENIEFQAVLQDLRGKPVEGRSVRWSVNKGSFEQEVTYTDANGRSSNRFFAPQVEGSEEVVVKAYFEGVRNFLPAEDLSYGTVSSVGGYVRTDFYFLDFSGGKTFTNTESLNYRGAFEADHAVNPGYALVMRRGDSLEVQFLVNHPLRVSALYLWGRSMGDCIVRVLLNGQVVFSGTTREGKISPTDVQVVALGNQVELGRNRLNIMIESQEEKAFYALQRLMVVF